MDKPEFTDFEIKVLKWLRGIAQDSTTDIDESFFLQTGERNWAHYMVDIANKYAPDWYPILERFAAAGYLGDGVDTKKTASARRQYIFDTIMAGRLLPLLEES